MPHYNNDNDGNLDQLPEAVLVLERIKLLNIVEAAGELLLLGMLDGIGRFLQLVDDLIYLVKALMRNHVSCSHLSALRFRLMSLLQFSLCFKGSFKDALKCQADF